MSALCARCAIDKDPTAAHVRFNCTSCKVTKYISSFSPVTIRAWKNKRKGEDSHWMCFDCLHPQCGMCEEPPVYAVVHNSWVKEAELYKHATTEEENTEIRSKLTPATTTRFARNEAAWFCTRCKYPTCSGCQKEKYEKLNGSQALLKNIVKKYNINYCFIAYQFA